MQCKWTMWRQSVSFWVTPDLVPLGSQEEEGFTQSPWCVDKK